MLRHRNEFPVEGELPSFDGATTWLNGEPLTPADLRGRVVLVNFGTYTCINWLRSLPYVRAWADKYANQDLVVVGVQTPEFEFEGDLYGQWVRITWVERLREVERFASVQQLQEQMERDRADALAALARGRPVPTA